MEYEIPEDASVSEAVITAVGDAEDVAKDELPPLYHAIDPDSLDKISAHWERHEGGPDNTVSFEYSDSLVTVQNGGSITIQSGVDTATTR